MQKLRGLNPYYTGRCSLSVSVVITNDMDDAVLILIILEDAL